MPFVALLAVASTGCRATSAAPEPPVAETAATDHRTAALRLYDEAGYPSVAGLERVRWVNGDNMLYAWRLDAPPGVLRLLFDDLRTLEFAETPEGAAWLARARRERAPSRFRAPVVGGEPRVHYVPELVAVDFSATTRRWLAGDSVPATILDGREARFGDPSSRTDAATWVVQAAWAAMRGDDSLAHDLLARAEIEAADTRSTIDTLMRARMQQVVARDVRAGLAEWLPWTEALTRLRDALALDPEGPAAPELRALVERIEHRLTLPEADGDPFDPRTSLDAGARVAALVRMLPEETEGPSSIRHADEWHPFMHLVHEGRTAVPALAARLDDETISRSGTTVGMLALSAIDWIVHLDDPEAGSVYASDDRHGMIEEWIRTHPPDEDARGRRPPPLPPPATALPATWGEGLDVPEWATPGFDLAALPLRAEILTAGDVSMTPEGPWIAASQPEPVATEEEEEEKDDDDDDDDDDIWRVVVATTVVDDGVDPDTRPSLGNGRRVRLLCEAAGHRVATWLPATRLRVTNRVPLLLAPRRPQVADVDTPGVRVPAGSNVRFARPRRGRVQASYLDRQVQAHATVDATSIDVVWNPALPELPVPEGDAIDLLGDTVTFRDTPAGRVVARLSLEHEPESATLLEQRGDEHLVYVELDRVSVVGWVPAAATRPAPGNTGLLGKGGGGGRSWRRWGPWAFLPRGTLLVDEDTRTVVGVVAWEGHYECVGACSEPIPLVTVRACESDSVRLRAVRPAMSR